MTPKKIKMKFLTLPGPSLFNTSFVYRPFLPLSNLHLGDFCGFKGNLVYGLALALVGHRSIDLGRGDIPRRGAGFGRAAGGGWALRAVRHGAGLGRSRGHACGAWCP